jgi:PPP family 3-phenylpropionic acid transporter
VTLNHLGDKIHGYTAIRLWGSVGFIVTVVILGMVLERVGIAPVPWIAMLMVIGIWLTALMVPDDVNRPYEQDHGPIIKVVKQPTMIAILVVFFLMQVGHGAYYSFYSLYLEKFDYTRTMIGQLWALGVLAEVGVFMIMLKVFQRYSLRSLFLVSMLCAAVRWFVIAEFPEIRAMIIFGQVLHGATFGLHHAVAIQLIHRYFKGRHQGRGQAIYSALSFGAGGAVGALLSGYTWEGLGPAETFQFAGVISLIGAAVVWKWVRLETPN